MMGRKYHGKKGKCLSPAFTIFPFNISKTLSFIIVISRQCVAQSYQFKNEYCRADTTAAVYTDEGASYRNAPICEKENYLKVCLFNFTDCYLLAY